MFQIEPITVTYFEFLVRELTLTSSGHFPVQAEAGRGR